MAIAVASRSIGARWLYALKPASWPKLLVPALLGQAMGVHEVRGAGNPVALCLGLGFTVAGLAFIVLINDWGDREVDAVKRRMFPDGCSPKTIPDGVLPQGAVLGVGVATAVVAAAIAGLAELVLRRPHALLLGLACMAVFVGYTLPPLRLNYRGGGELLEALGVGFALPAYNAYLQGAVGVHTWALLPGFVSLCLASASASGLADEESDRAGGKRTFAVLLGNTAARRLTESALLVGCALWFTTWLLGIASWLVLIPTAIVATYAWRLRAISDAANTNAFVALNVYKSILHRAIWYGALAMAIVLLFERYVFRA